MIFPKANPLSFAAMAAAAVLFAACGNASTSPRTGTSAEARADLQAMASKVRYFAPQKPGSGNTADGAAKRGAARLVAAPGRAAGKASAGAEPLPGCDVSATEYETWDTDTSAVGGITVQYDTTVSYTSANQPICGIEDVTAYQLTATRSENAMLSTHMNLRFDLPADFTTGEFKLTGAGNVDYKDGYLIDITLMDIEIDFGTGTMKTYVMNLALEKGYTVVLTPAPGADMMSDTEPDPNAVQVGGPISKDGTVVGRFEVLGDNHVIIRDADNVIIESHG